MRRGCLAIALVAAASLVAPRANAQAATKWYDTIDVGAFVDTYYAHNWRRPRPNEGANLYQPYTSSTGFGLAWLGLDLGVQPDPVGAVLQLRFGPAVPNLALSDFGLPGGIGYVQNGYVTWRPSGKDGRLTLYAGKFDTVFGAEVAVSQDNVNYSRGLLYNLAQPFFHTGLRADWQIGDLVQVKALAVNGWNDTLDNNRGKTFGGQLVLSPLSGLNLAAGWLGGPEENDVIDAPDGGEKIRNPGADGRWRHLFDVVGDLSVGKARFVVNADYVTQAIAPGGPEARVAWYGAAALARYALTEQWAMAARAEIVRDDNGQITAPNTDPLTLYSGTLTLELAPHRMLLLRLDNRIDAADARVFPTGFGGSESTQLTTILGIVAKTK